VAWLETLLAHEAFDPMQAAGYALCQEVVPDSPSAVGADTTGPDPGADLIVVTGTPRWRTGEPGMKAAS
jgi:hypothetical protein